MPAVLKWWGAVSWHISSACPEHIWSRSWSQCASSSSSAWSPCPHWAGESRPAPGTWSGWWPAGSQGTWCVHQQPSYNPASHPASQLRCQSRIWDHIYLDNVCRLSSSQLTANLTDYLQTHKWCHQHSTLKWVGYLRKWNRVSTEAFELLFNVKHGGSVPC